MPVSGCDFLAPQPTSVMPAEVCHANQGDNFKGSDTMQRQYLQRKDIITIKYLQRATKSP